MIFFETLVYENNILIPETLWECKHSVTACLIQAISIFTGNAAVHRLRGFHDFLVEQSGKP